MSFYSGVLYANFFDFGVSPKLSSCRPVILVKKMGHSVIEKFRTQNPRVNGHLRRVPSSFEATIAFHSATILLLG